MQRWKENIEGVCHQLRSTFRRSIEKISFDGSTLSGGLDTSIVNYVASKQAEILKSVTGGLEGSEMKDLEY